MNEKIDLTILLVNYNTKHFLKNCLESIFANIKDIKYEVIVVDNNSQDGSLEFCNELLINTTVIKNERNVGFAAAVNGALNIIKGDILLLLNTDTIVLKNGLYDIIKVLKDNQDIKIAGGKVLNEDGSLQCTCRYFPGYITFLTMHTVNLIKKLNLPLIKKYKSEYFNCNVPREVDWVSGCYMLIKREIINKFGLFDESFFMFCEDVDFCYRMKKKNIKTFFIPFSPIIHFGGQSSELNEDKAIIYSFNNSCLYIRKNINKFFSYIYKYNVLILWVIFLLIFFIASVFTKNSSIRKKYKLFKSLLGQYWAGRYYKNSY